MIVMMSSFCLSDKECSCNKDQKTSNQMECHSCRSITDFFLTDEDQAQTQICNLRPQHRYCPYLRADQTSTNRAWFGSKVRRSWSWMCRHLLQSRNNSEDALMVRLSIYMHRRKMEGKVGRKSGGMRQESQQNSACVCCCCCRCCCWLQW